MTLSILYRGPLESCNYGCVYCPFRKRKEGRQALAKDRAALARFVEWARHFDDSLSVFFTPWGEALIRPWYREAIVALSRLATTRRVAIQTNLSAPLGFLRDADASKVALWCTYHPEWTTRERFLVRLAQLQSLGVRYSVGVVGFRRFVDEIAALREALPREVYLWVNAVKTFEGGERYTPEEARVLETVDPLFRFNAVAHPSKGRPCRTGESVVSVDGRGDVRRCHFVPSLLGNLYETDVRTLLAPRACPKETCGCHIGYVHMPELGLEDVFREGILERAPRRLPVLSRHSPTAT